MKRIIQCRLCNGTGLEKTPAEVGGAAVVCPCCNGTGKEEITVNSSNETKFSYKDFTGRKEMEGVTRVYMGSYGFIHSDHDIVTEDGRELHFSRFGCTYEEWKDGVEPKPMEELYCPYVFVDEDYMPLSRCREGCDWGPACRCKYYSNKSECWEEWHKNRKKQQP